MDRVYNASAATRHQGFTLIEIMVVVIIIALLASVAIPSYRDHIIKTKRATAQSFMSQAANKEEQILLDLRGYSPVQSNANFSNAPAPANPATSGIGLPIPADVAANYSLQISVTAAAPGIPPAFLITATPIDPPQHDPRCGVLTLDQTGAKTVSGPAGVPGCW